MWTAINPISTRRTTYLTVDSYLQYTAFFSDFGPFDIADVFRFCCLMKERLELAKSQRKVLCLHTKPDDTKRANAAFALCCYMMLLHDMSPEEAYAPVEYIHPSITSFRDAGCGPVTYTLSIMDCLRGLRKGLDRGLLRLDKFNVKEYEHYERVSNGDFNWITPFFIAFAGPKDKMKREALTKKERTRLNKSFRSVLSYFSTHNVQCIIRLNDKTYDKAHFTARGIEHVDMIYPDGTCPPWYIVEQFFEVCERVAMDQGGVVAVHCMAGLGRTGTLIGAYLMRHFDMSARETIAFLRLMRPGSVVGPQQNWLAENEWRIRKRDY
ncbi:MAG: protein-tyrosine phosphatase-like protein, partial [Linnemannia gamsii]